MSRTRKILVPIVLILGLIQFIPHERPTYSADEADKIVVADSEVKNILDKACMDCHSNETTYPWYANVTPVNYWLEGHIENGREHLNFSEWNSMPDEDKKHAVKDLTKVIEKKEMPMLFYWLIHWDAKLTPEERASLVDYFNSIK
ncbi:MAG: heme-binding domain-containing protein [Flavobacteriales bacterium]